MSPDRIDAILRHLESPGEPLYALLDAARDPGVLKALQAGGRPYRSLYEGPEADELAEFGPFLVALDLEVDRGLTRRLVEEGWGRSWGYYLTSPADFDAIRHHFRHYLRVEVPGGAFALFRFYDPRVLREFLATWTPEESAGFLGPASRLAIEDAEGEDATLRESRASIAGDGPDRPR